MSTATLSSGRPPRLKAATADVAQSVWAAPSKNFFARIMDALDESRRLQARREIRRYADLVSKDADAQLHTWLTDR